ncbi:MULTISPECIES: hypothetical protein [unclassified Cupriavidus]|uniref:hypothetical protein n=1 Tax=unclassified Cupriavidus TaxID=2640874 RepID=UPI00257AA264|nr:MULTISPECIES: hypothetical protein [unclassified Cupriavidus]
MTISTTSNEVVAQGNGITTSFNFSFPVQLASHLLVYYTDATGAQTLLSPASYSVTGVGTANGGSVTYPLSGSPIATGTILTIQRIVPYKQLTDIVNQSGFYPNVVENALDYLTMEVQQLAQMAQLSLSVPFSATVPSLVLPGTKGRALGLVGFDANGNAIIYPVTASVGAGNLISEGPFVAGTNFTPGTTTTLTLSQSYGTAANVQVHFDGTYQGTDQYTLNGAQIIFNVPIPVGVNKVYVVGGTTLSANLPSSGSVGDAQINWGGILNRVVDSIAALRALSSGSHNRAFATGYYGAGDGGGGAYWYDPTDTTSTDNGGTIIVAGDGARWKLITQGFLAPKQFGARGNWNGTTGTDDSAALQACFTAAAAAGLWVDGGNAAYLVLSNITVTASAFKLRNCRFALGPDYTAQAQVAINCGTVELRSIYVDGGRGTYKTGNEAWVTFASANGYGSIEPAYQPFINVNSYGAGAAAQANIDAVHFVNMFAVACINIGTYGTVQISNCIYRNIANCTFTVYHSPDNGTTVAGRTQVNNVYAENVGLLPTTFLVGGVSTNFATSTAFPQGSFNFLVSFGDYSISNAVVWNYGATAITSDRNTTFNGSNIYVLCTAANAVSNNPSGAIWDEACGRFTLTNAVVDIRARDPRDYAQDSCALQLFVLDNQQVDLTNIIVKGNVSTAVANRAFRGSLFGSSAGQVINITNVHIDGLYVANAINFALSPNSVIDARIRMSQVYVASGVCNFDQPNVLELTNIQTSGDVTISTSGNHGITGAVAIVSLRDSNINNFSCTTTVAGTITVDDNETINGNVSISTCTGQVSVSGNKAIAGSINLSSGNPTIGSFCIANNAYVVGITTVTFARSAIVNGNHTTRRIEIKDVQTFNVTGNTAKTNTSESIIWINPVTAANILAGVISSNNVLIQTGTVGAGFVTIGGGVTNVTDVNNNKVTTNWS